MIKVGKALQSRKWTIVSLGVMFAMLAGLIAMGAIYNYRMEFIDSKSMFVKGTYSIDGGEWKPIESDKPIYNHWSEKVVFKGRLLDELDFYTNINISTKNIWYTLKTADGKLLAQHVHQSKEDYLEVLYETYSAMQPDPDDPMNDKEYFFGSSLEPVGKKLQYSRRNLINL